MATSKNSFGARGALAVGGQSLAVYRLPTSPARSAVTWDASRSR